MSHTYLEEFFKLLQEDDETSAGNTERSAEDIQLTTHLEYPDIVDGNLYSLNNGNPYGASNIYPNFRANMVNNTPHPFKLLVAGKQVFYRLWFLKKDDAQRYVDEYPSSCKIISKAQKSFRAIRIDVNGDIPLYADISYIKSVNPDLLHPVILNRLASEKTQVIPHISDAQTRPLSINTEDPKYLKAKNLVDDIEETFSGVEGVKIDRNESTFNCFIPLTSFLNLPAFAEIQNQKEVTVPNFLYPTILGLNLSKTSMLNNDIEVRVITADGKKVHKEKLNIKLPNLIAYLRDQKADYKDHVGYFVSDIKHKMFNKIVKDSLPANINQLVQLNGNGSSIDIYIYPALRTVAKIPGFYCALAPSSATLSVSLDISTFKLNFSNDFDVNKIIEIGVQKLPLINKDIRDIASFKEVLNTIETGLSSYLTELEGESRIYVSETEAE